MYLFQFNFPYLKIRFLLLQAQQLEPEQCNLEQKRTAETANSD
jgi:hypothetical protein